jgi:poly-beta-1,6-N-acetyl-D-glucosamine synthase
MLAVLIPAHNEAATIGATLGSLRHQTRVPDRVIVVCDNCTDATADIAAGAGAEVLESVGNTAKKAGALNQALAWLLPVLADEDRLLVMDADSHLNDGWLEAASRALDRIPASGAVCGVFLGEPGGGLLGQLQRNEYFRYARQVSRRSQSLVLSGTGSLFRVSALRALAAERGRRIKGIHGECYNRLSITEDDEITLALKSLGHRCLTVPGCETITELMPTWRDLWRQRLRWQTGTLRDLRNYGLTWVTCTYWARQIIIYLALVGSLSCWVIMVASLVIHPGISVAWTGGIFAINFTERLWTVRRAGPRGMLVSALMVPEFGYDVWRMCVFARALADEIAQRDIQWTHLARAAAS